MGMCQEERLSHVGLVDKFQSVVDDSELVEDFIIDRVYFKFIREDAVAFDCL